MAKQDTETYSHAAAAKILATAKKMVSEGSQWIDVSNAIFGVGSSFSKDFPTQESREAFHGGPEYAELFRLMASLKLPPSPEATAPSGKVLVRMPKSLHASLLKEAEAEGVSLNQLAVAKLAIGFAQRVGETIQ